MNFINEDGRLCDGRHSQKREPAAKTCHRIPDWPDCCMRDWKSPNKLWNARGHQSIEAAAERIGKGLKLIVGTRGNVSKLPPINFIEHRGVLDGVGFV